MYNQVYCSQCKREIVHLHEDDFRGRPMDKYKQLCPDCNPQYISGMITMGIIFFGGGALVLLGLYHLNNWLVSIGG